MNTDSTAAIAGALGLIDDDMDTLLPGYAEAAAELADFASWESKTRLIVKEELRASGQLTKDALGITTKEVTEKAIADRVLHEMHQRYPEEYETHRQMSRIKARGDILFKGYDARRSIGQTLMKMHQADQFRSPHGQGAHGQAGQ